jgi:hypothetical protein
MERIIGAGLAEESTLPALQVTTTWERTGVDRLLCALVRRRSRYLACVVLIPIKLAARERLRGRESHWNLTVTFAVLS